MKETRYCSRFNFSKHLENWPSNLNMHCTELAQTKGSMHKL